MKELLSVEKVSKWFPNKGKPLHVLHHISLTLHQGEIVCVLGKSGCGKTTLLNIISNLEPPSDGAVVTTASLGYVPQKDLLFPWRTVMENILLPREIQGNVTKQDIVAARSLLRELDLEKFENAYPHEISGGMRQKVSVIRTLMQNPACILFDEAFSAIDFDSRLMLGKKIRSYLVQAKKAALFVTHNIEEAISLGDKIIVLSQRPAQVIAAVDVKIHEKNRDPVILRKTKKFQNLFERIWRMMRHSA